MVRKEAKKNVLGDAVHMIRGDESSFGYHLVRRRGEEKNFGEYMTKNTRDKRVFLVTTW
jgi:hypothetical protein